MADITVPAAPIVDPSQARERLEVIAQAQGALRAWRAAACDFEFEDHISDLQVSARAIAEMLYGLPELRSDIADASFGLVFGKALIQTAEQALWAACIHESLDMPDADSMRQIATLALDHLDTYVATIRQAIEAPSQEAAHG